MATMNRNVNLEEINTDTFMGIPFLNDQTIGQKIIFWGSLILGIAWNIIGNFAFHLNGIVIILFTLVPLCLGVIFGCNYNQDLSLYQYLRLIIFKPCTVYVSKPIEDIEQLKKEAERLDKEAEEKKKSDEITPESQRRFLIRLLTVALIVIVVFIIFLIVLASMNNDVLHHIVEM